jgi:predicted nuclease of restriction endonuclease-like RecB superfamily
MNNRVSQLNSITEEFFSAFSRLNKDDLNWSPDSSTWSIARNIDHLIVINSTYFPLFDAIKSGNFKEPFLGKFGFWVDWIGSFILKSVQPIIIAHERRHLEQARGVFGMLKSTKNV